MINCELLAFQEGICPMVWVSELLSDTDIYEIKKTYESEIFLLVYEIPKWNIFF